MNIQHLLFPVDFSNRCIGTVPFVAEIVAKFGAKLSLIHVVEFPSYLYATVAETSPGVWDLFEENFQIAAKKLSTFAAEQFPQICSLGTICERGTPADAILAHAEKLRADLIMMPTHGHSPFRSFMLGSVTAKVLHRAECPVWTGAHLDTDPARRHLEVQRILCALDLEKDSLHVIRSAVCLAGRFGASVHLVHSVPATETGPVAHFESEFDRFLADTARQGVERLQAQARTNLPVSLLSGPVSKVVREAAAEYDADLIVIGRGHVQTPFSRMRTNAHAIIREAPCPVISL